MSNQVHKYILAVITLLTFNVILFAQERKVTPVETDDEKPAQPVLHYYDKHGKPLKEPVLFLAELDTVTKVKSGPVFPLLTSVTVGVNVFDLAMTAFGQSYANVDMWGKLSMFNWVFPALEIGMGYGSKHPEDLNYHYKANPSVYIRIGADYNFLYKSTPKYQPFVGFRFGFSSFKYNITDIQISSGYWGETNEINLRDQRSIAFYGQLVAGLQVEIAKNWSLGWTARYNLMFHCKDSKNGKPWFVPGYGANNKLGATFSLSYTFPLCNVDAFLNKQNGTSDE